MYNTVNEQFKDAMKREGKPITTITNKETYNVLFRKNSDKNSRTNKMQIFYDRNFNIHSGQLISYENKTFLILNQETVENSIYFRSDAIECNGHTSILTIGSGNIAKETFISFYANDMQSIVQDSGTGLQTVGGIIEMWTESNPENNKIKVNEEFDVLGGKWRIINRYIKSGILYLFVDRSSSSTTEKTYDLVITGIPNYYVGTNTRLLANSTVKVGNNTYTIENPSLIWKSSNPSIVSVDREGNIECKAEGDAIIACDWLNHEIMATLVIHVGILEVHKGHTDITASEFTVPLGGMARTFTGVLYDEFGGIVTNYDGISFNWSRAANDVQNKYTVIAYPTVNTCTVKINYGNEIDNNLLLGSTFDLTLDVTSEDTTRKYDPTTKSVRIKSLI